MVSALSDELTARGIAHTFEVHADGTHVNLLGNVHGGVVMRLVDSTAGAVAQRHSGGPAVTAAMDEMAFLAPVHVGDIIRTVAQVNWAGRTSMEIGVRVESEPWDEAGVEPPAAPSAEVEALAAIGEARVVALLRKLTPDQRSVLALRVVADLSLEQTAAVLGRDVGSVKSLQHRALARLRREVSVTPYPQGTLTRLHPRHA